jgi:hypothetical protein
MGRYLECRAGALSMDWIVFGTALVVVAFGLVDLASEEGGAILELLRGEGLSGLLEALVPPGEKGD